MVESKKLESAMAELRRGERESLRWKKQKIERGATVGVGGGERRLTMSLRTSAMAEQGREIEEREIDQEDVRKREKGKKKSLPHGWKKKKKGLINVRFVDGVN